MAFLGLFGVENLIRSNKLSQGISSYTLAFYFAKVVCRETQVLYRIKVKYDQEMTGK